MEFWLITITYGREKEPATLAIDQSPVSWLIEYGRHGKADQIELLFALPISEPEYEAFCKVRS